MIAAPILQQILEAVPIFIYVPKLVAVPIFVAVPRFLAQTILVSVHSPSNV